MPKQFRTQESLDAEAMTRNMVAPFLASVGCSDIRESRKKTGTAQSQTVEATLPSGVSVRMKVKTCWRPRGRSERQASYDAAQLIAKVSPGEGEMRVRAFAAKAQKDGVTHLMLIQTNGIALDSAVLIPLSALGNIWALQRDKSDQYNRNKASGGRSKNLAENGHSPTIYLRHDAAIDVANALWNYAGVIDLKSLALVQTKMSAMPLDDTFQDILIPDFTELGKDSPLLFRGAMSYVQRDPRVRRAVIMRAGNTCERPGCFATRAYAGFFDVHHILGVGKSDRVWNCVALCPNCHREAHVSPQADLLNEQLLEVANAYK